jgi:hypothetical protein
MCTEGLWDFKSCKQKSCVSPQARQDAFICTLSRDGLLLLWHTDQKMLVVFSGKIQAGSLPVSVYFLPWTFLYACPLYRETYSWFVFLILLLVC